MNIEFIKWMCSKAEGFDFYTHEECDQIEYKTHFGCYTDDLEREEWLNHHGKSFVEVYYPLLLQRAIEGVNKQEEGYFINIDCENIHVYHFDNCHEYKYFNYGEYDKPIDQSKEAALKYIYEQE